MKKKAGRPVGLLLAILMLAAACLPVPAAAADMDLEVTVKGALNQFHETATIFVGETLKLNVILAPQVYDVDIAAKVPGFISSSKNNIKASQVIEVTGLTAGTDELEFYELIMGMPYLAGKITFTVKKGNPVTVIQPAEGGHITPPGNTSGKVYVETGGESPKFQAIPDAGYHFFTLYSDGTPWGTDNLQYLTMTKPHALEAVFKPNSHLVTVNNGTGSGNHDYGSTVNIEADPAPAGMHFKEWQTSDVTLANPGDALTGFTMPDNAVALTAVYEANRHDVAVTGGSGGGNYGTGDTVSITADPAPRGMRFREWQTADVTLPDPSAASTGFTMPDHDVNLTAVYEKRPATTPGLVNAGLDMQSADFDRNPASAGHRDVSVTLSPGSYSLRGIRMRGVPLTAGKDYTVSGGSYTFASAFLGGLSEGVHPIAFDMSGGTDPVLTVTVTDSAEPWSNPFKM